MLSIIICSVSEERLRLVEANIDRTVGCDHEFIAIDNAVKKWPIAKAYNQAARKARYPYLLFAHEDIEFLIEGWGPFIENKLREDSCGVIGFAGNKAKLRCYSGWGQYYKWDCSYMYQGFGPGDTRFLVSNATLENPFTPVVILDGMALFVRRDLWEAHPFDESLLKGFHCYDLDFTMQIATAGYRNYLCSTNRVLVKHASLGSYTPEWYRDTVRLYDKWKSKLPIRTDDAVADPKILRNVEERYSNQFLREIQRLGLPESRIVLREFLREYPMNWRHFRHCVEALFRALAPRKTQK